MSKSLLKNKIYTRDREIVKRRKKIRKNCKAERRKLWYIKLSGKKDNRAYFLCYKRQNIVKNSRKFPHFLSYLIWSLFRWRNRFSRILAVLTLVRKMQWPISYCLFDFIIKIEENIDKMIIITMICWNSVKANRTEKQKMWFLF